MRFAWTCRKVPEAGANPDPAAGPRLIALSLLLILYAAACAPLLHVETQTHFPSQADRLPNSEYLKVHFADGRLAILQPWRVDSKTRVVSGTGVLLSSTRDTLAIGRMSVPVDSVALFETNVTRPSAVIAPLTVVTIASVAISVYCLINPKECFGSCPTFYLSDGGREMLRAEGFSASVMPCLEATDIDALDPELLIDRGRGDAGTTLELVMRNEAYETHVVRSVRLLVAERADGTRVVRQVRGPLRQVVPCASPAGVFGREGDITALVTAADGRERTSRADSTDLAAREEVRATFARPSGDSLGLVLVSRQSLLPTFVFYHSLALLGSNLAPLLARASTGGEEFQSTARRIWDELGGIEVSLATSEGSRRLGSIFETGPLATDAVMIPLGALPASGDSITITLSMARGAWRIDELSLCELGPVVTPIAVEPAWVAREASDRTEVRDDSARDLLRPEGDALVTLPGDTYRLHFDLPCARANAEIFLESRGYYLEWMREAWLAEEDPAMAARLFLDPRGMLKTLAPRFKQIEPEQERLFWRSKYVPR